MKLTGCLKGFGGGCKRLILSAATGAPPEFIEESELRRLVCLKPDLLLPELTTGAGGGVW